MKRLRRYFKSLAEFLLILAVIFVGFPLTAFAVNSIVRLFWVPEKGNSLYSIALYLVSVFVLLSLVLGAGELFDVIKQSTRK